MYSESESADSLYPAIGLSSRKTDFPDAVCPVMIRRTGGYGEVFSVSVDIVVGDRGAWAWAGLEQCCIAVYVRARCQNAA